MFFKSEGLSQKIVNFLKNADYGKFETLRESKTEENFNKIYYRQEVSFLIVDSRYPQALLHTA